MNVKLEIKAMLRQLDRVEQEVDKLAEMQSMTTTFSVVDRLLGLLDAVDALRRRVKRMG